MIALGIPSLNNFDLLQQCVDSALAGDLPPDVVYVTDNSEGKYPEGWQKRYENRVMVHRADRNYGVARSWNIMVSIALGRDARWIILSNDDITFAPDTIATLVAVAEGDGRAGIVSPIEGQRFACFLLNPQAYREVGPFDEVFHPAYFEDNDYHRRLTLAGWESPVAPSALGHVGSATYQAKSPAEQAAHHAMFARNQRKYLAKWGGLPGQERYTEPYDGDAP